MPLVFTVTNPAPSPATLYLMGRAPTADFLIADSAGRTVWSLRHGQTVMASLQVYPFGAGQSLSFRQVWNQRSNAGKPVSPGDYLVHAVLLSDRPGGMESPVVKVTVE